MPDQLRLLHKSAIITGAATGIGEAIAHKFASEGAAVMVVGLPGDPVEEVANEITRHAGRAVPFAGDISEEQTARMCIQLAIDNFGQIDCLVNNAGSFPNMAETQEFPVEDFELLIKNNIRSAFVMTHYCLPHLQKTRGVVLCAGSESGIIGIAKATPYGGTKGFMHAFVRGLAVEQARHGVRANCVCPGPIDTSWTHRNTGPMDKKTETMMVEAVPMGRRGTPEEVANVYAFLASDEASYVTGALWTVDGGVTIGKGPVGAQVPQDLKKPPPGRLDLSHSREGRPRGEQEAPRESEV
jgi:NAD(P)-dependent dehydrogenase (short-subunit alcohol dehydrogenase family)